MDFLEVPGAQLVYETRGSGPLLLMIPGATGTGGAFTMVADALSAHYTVATYDRRGFSRSHLMGTPDEARRLETDADDVQHLITHLSDEPAIVFGSSSGGIVALEVLTRHPSVVRTLVAFEPPAMRFLPDGQQWVDFFSQVYDIYRKSGIEPALAMFREHTFAVSDRQLMAQATTRKDQTTRRADATYWFERELRDYPAVGLDQAVLAAHADRIVPAAGEESRGYPCYEVAVALGKQLGRNVLELPGGHVGYVAHPTTFARTLHDALACGASHGEEACQPAPEVTPRYWRGRTRR